MGLGIGANTAVFSVVNAVLLKPLVYREPDSILTLSTAGKRDASRSYVSALDFHDWHDQSASFAAGLVLAFTGSAALVSLAPSDVPRLAETALMNACSLSLS
jgi:hypothetical protein